MLGDSLRRRRGPGKRPREEADDRPDRKPERTGRRRFTVGHWILAAIVILLGSFGVGYFLSTQVLFPRPETAGMGASVPDLYGQTRADAEAAIREAGLAVGEVRELASLDADAGRVLAQTPVAGQQLPRDAQVSFAVSGGPPEVRVPPVVRMRLTAARELLESTGFEVEVRDVEAPGAEPGMVLRVDPAAGTTRPLPSRVVLTVAVSPAADSVPAGVAPVGTGEPRGGENAAAGGGG